MIIKITEKHWIFKRMSSLIDLEFLPVLASPEQIKGVLKSIFKSSQFCCQSTTDQGRHLAFHLQASASTHRLPTIWQFLFCGDQISLTICCYNSSQNDLLRAYTHRMRIELSIFMNMVNKHVMPRFCFFVDCFTGIVSLRAWMTYPEMSLNRSALLFWVKYYFQQLYIFDDLFRFVEPSEFYSKQMNSRDRKISQKINRFRTVLKNTRNARKQMEGCIGDIIKHSKKGTPLNSPQFNQIRTLFTKNMVAFQKSVQGLENINDTINPKEFVQELNEVTKNEIGVTHFQENNKKKIEQIVYGLVKIEADPNSQVKLLSEEGAHAQIFRNNFMYKYIETINDGTATNFTTHGRIVKGELTFKICNKMKQGSINSFNNEIKTLDYMRSRYSPFVARYFMEIKKKWDENDVIYMSNYNQNVHNLIKNGTSYCLKTRLDLAYKIAKGLCFLYSIEVVHRDFKPHNIVVDGNMIPKIIDFGSSISHFSKNKYSPHDERLLTTHGYNLQYYTLPDKDHATRQKFTKREYDEHPLFDVYGFGRTLSFLFFGSIIPPPPEGYLSSPLFEILDHIIFLINMCTKTDPDDRPGFGELTSFLGALGDLLKEKKYDEELLPPYDDSAMDI